MRSLLVALIIAASLLVGPLPDAAGAHCPSQRQIDEMPPAEAAVAARCAADEARAERQAPALAWLDRVTGGRCPQPLVEALTAEHYFALELGMTEHDALCAVYRPWRELRRAVENGVGITTNLWRTDDGRWLTVRFRAGRLVSKDAGGLR